MTHSLYLAPCSAQCRRLHRVFECVLAARHASLSRRSVCSGRDTTPRAARAVAGRRYGLAVWAEAANDPHPDERTRTGCVSRLRACARLSRDTAVVSGATPAVAWGTCHEDIPLARLCKDPRCGAAQARRGAGDEHRLAGFEQLRLQVDACTNSAHGRKRVRPRQSGSCTKHGERRVHTHQVLKQGLEVQRRSGGHTTRGRSAACARGAW